MRLQVLALVTLGLARLGDAGTSLQFGSTLDSHWLGQMTTAGWVTLEMPQHLQLIPNPGDGDLLLLAWPTARGPSGALV